MAGKLTITLALAAFGLMLIACAPGLDASLTSLEKGDCVKDPGFAFQVDSLKHADCDEGVLLVTRVFEIKGYEEWPGQATVRDIAGRECTYDTTTVMFPTEETWNGINDRNVVCFKEL